MDAWLMTFEEFSGKVKAINSKQYSDDYFSLKRKHCTGCHYYLYISDELKIMNPYTKKDKNKRQIKSFASTSSALDVKEQAYLFILKYAQKEGLFDASICNFEISSRQIKYINQKQIK